MAKLKIKQEIHNLINPEKFKPWTVVVFDNNKYTLLDGTELTKDEYEAIKNNKIILIDGKDAKL